MPSSAAVSPQGPSLAGSWASMTGLWLSGVFVILLGITAVIGWFTQQRMLVGLLPDFPPIVLNTALMFIASGLAMVALANARRYSVTILALGVGILALAILAEHISGADLGIDHAALHEWAQDGFPHPGRSSPPTAVCFVLLSLALIRLARPATASGVHFTQLLGWVVVLLGGSSAFGNLLGLDVLYTSYPLRGMAFPTAVGMMVMGFTVHHAAASKRDTDAVRDDAERIVSVGTALLIVVALATGLPVIYLVKAHIESTLASGLRTAIVTQVQLIDTIVELRMQRAAIITNRPLALQTLRTLNRDPQDPAALALLQTTLESFRPHGFSALEVTLGEGVVAAGSGSFVADSAMRVRLKSETPAELIWHDGFFLRTQFRFTDGGVDLGGVDMEQNLAQMQAAVMTGQQLGESGELQLCQHTEKLIRCFPSRRNPLPFDLPYVGDAGERLVQRAAAGGSGFASGRDELGHRVIGVYAPVGTHGLFVVLKVDTAELYGSLRRDVEQALLLALVAIVAGSLLFRRLVRPMAEKLVHAQQASAKKSQAIERLHDFQRAIFDHAPDGIVVTDREGRIIESNERMAVLFGHNAAQLATLSIDDLVPEKYRAQHHLHRASFHAAPTTRPMSSDRSLFGQRADGTQFPIEVALAPFASALGDRVIAIVKDVTDARRREQAIQQLHAFQRAVFDHAPDGIVVTDREGRIVEANNRMALMFGYDTEHLRTLSIDDLVPSKLRAHHHRHRASFHQAPSTRTMSRDRSLFGERADGTQFPIEVALAPLQSADGDRVIAIVKDVTDARKGEQAIRDALKEKDVLLGEIHHRVKNNLQIIHSLLDMQATRTTDLKAASALRDSQNRIQSMALIHQTLYQSRDFAEVDFGQFLATLGSHLQSSYQRNDLKLEVRAERVQLSIDRAIPCGLIVNELVTNALKHAFPDGRAGSIAIDLRVHRGIDVELSVSDDGIGIADALDLENLPSLGMQLVQVLTEQIHAELHIRRRSPTRFSFTFPLHPGKPDRTSDTESRQ
ncbi:MAG: sensor histidine kinase [Panacagrimonas sp.]